MNTSGSTRRNVNNARGRNQHKDCPEPGDPRFAELLKAYDRRGICNAKILSGLFVSEHGIKVSDKTVTRRRRALGLKASRAMTNHLPSSTKRQLVLDQMAKDPAGKLGSRSVKLGIFRDTGIHLTREWIANEMRILNPDAYSSRGPPHNKGRRPNELHYVHSTGPPNAGNATRNITQNHQPEPSTISSATSIPTPPTEFHNTWSHFDAAGPSATPSFIPNNHPTDQTQASDFAADFNDIQENEAGLDDPEPTIPQFHPPNYLFVEPDNDSTSRARQGVDRSLVFNLLQSTTPKLAELQNMLQDIDVRDQREVDIVINFRKQLDSLSMRLPRCP